MSNKEVHCNVFTIHELGHHVSDTLGHPVAVQVTIVLERRECDDLIPRLGEGMELRRDGVTVATVNTHDIQ